MQIAEEHLCFYVMTSREYLAALNVIEGGITMNYIFRHWDGEAGGNRTFWLSSLNTIAKMIDQHDLKPVAKEMIPAGAYAMSTEMMQHEFSEVALKRGWVWPCGGIKGPHLHFGPEIYQLDENQWADFSLAVIKDCQSRLATANTVTVEQLIDVGEAINAIPLGKG
jgi:hypothetical protein